MDRVAIALGSSLGDRSAHLNHAVSRLQGVLTGLTVSHYYETAPVGGADPQPFYLNAAAVGDSPVDARALLEILLAIELERGRVREYPNAPRTLDLDLILYGSAIIDEPGLVVPHARFRDRRFVLEPLAEIAPDLVDPVTSDTVASLLAKL